MGTSPPKPLPQMPVVPLHLLGQLRRHLRHLGSEPASEAVADQLVRRSQEAPAPAPAAVAVTSGGPLLRGESNCRGEKGALMIDEWRDVRLALGRQADKCKAFMSPLLKGDANCRGEGSNDEWGALTGV